MQVLNEPTHTHVHVRVHVHVHVCTACSVNLCYRTALERNREQSVV